MHHSGSGRLTKPSPWGTSTSYSSPASWRTRLGVMNVDSVMSAACPFMLHERRNSGQAGISGWGHSRRFGFVRFRRHCGHEFLRQRRDGPGPDSTRPSKFHPHSITSFSVASTPGGIVSRAAWRHCGRMSALRTLGQERRFSPQQRVFSPSEHREVGRGHAGWCVVSFPTLRRA